MILSVCASSQPSPTSTIGQCKTFCDQANFPEDCKSKAQSGTGLCFECGPKKPADSKEDLCDGKCTNIKTDEGNCGRCGNEVSDM